MKQLFIHSFRVDMDTMYRYPHLIEAVNYMSHMMPDMVEAASDVDALVDAVTKLLPEEAGTFKVNIVDDHNEPVQPAPGATCFLYITEPNLRIH